MIAPDPASAGAAPALEMRGIRKTFGSIIALDDVSLRVTSGSVHALLGENGAGKTTLMRIAYGLTTADAGSMRVFGATASGHSVRSAMRAGLGMVHQHLSLVPNLSAAENLQLGGQGAFHPGRAAKALQHAAAQFGLAVPPDAVAADLTIVEQQRLEILKALSRGARLLILDEPTAILAPGEARELMAWIRAFANDGGSVVLITHKLREALAVADQVTILRRGRVAWSGEASGSTEADLGRAMLPDALPPQGAPPPVAPSAAVVRADGVTLKDERGATRVRDASFEIRSHEIVGIAAVEGSGHRALLAAIAGRARVSSGTLILPADVSLIPAHRLRDAIVPEFTLTENVALRHLGRRRGLMRWPAVRARTESLAQRFSVVARSVDAAMSSLSGGNQQRLVVGRELEYDVPLVVADNPTRGLDIGATAFVHEQLRAAAARGCAVVLHSSDLDEVLALATRMLVVYDGTVREVRGNADDIGRAMLGAGPPSSPERS